MARSLLFAVVTMVILGQAAAADEGTEQCCMQCLAVCLNVSAGPKNCVC